MQVVGWLVFISSLKVHIALSHYSLPLILYPKRTFVCLRKQGESHKAKMKIAEKKTSEIFCLILSIEDTFHHVLPVNFRPICTYYAAYKQGMKIWSPTVGLLCKRTKISLAKILIVTVLRKQKKKSTKLFQIMLYFSNSFQNKYWNLALASIQICDEYCCKIMADLKSFTYGLWTLT